ncbi:MAG: hypothetical protein HOP31_15695 [Ignavibacteria bacterium]|nr:hypothetical protein [Ignavibacteria bacterium]
MRANDSLFILISSLDRRELIAVNRALLKNNASGKYRRIFRSIRSIGRAGKYVEDDIIKKSGCRNKNAFSVSKNYLYGIIVNILINLNTTASSDGMIKMQISFIDLMYKRTLYSKAYEQLKKTKRKAYISDNFLRLVEIIRLERNLVIELITPAKKTGVILSLFEEEKTILAKINNISEYRCIEYQIRETISDTVSTGKKYNHKLLGFRKRSVLSSQKKALSFAALASFYNTNSIISMYCDDIKGTYRFRKKLVEHIETRKDVKFENPTNYIVSLYNLIESCYEMLLPEEMITYIYKLRLFAERVKIPENSKLLSDLGCSKQELKYSLIKPDIDASEKVSKILFAYLGEYKGKISGGEESECLYLIAVSDFLTKSYEDAVINLNRIISYEKVNNEALNVNVKTLNIISHFELRNVELVIYLVNSLTRSLSSIKLPGEFQTVLSKFLKGLSLVNTDSELKFLIDTNRKAIAEYFSKNNDQIMNNAIKGWLNDKFK